MSLQSEYYNSLVHHGIKGQKWGVRRYQNPDGTLTNAGKKRVSNKQIREEKSQIYRDEYNRLSKEYGVDDKYNAAYKYAEEHGLAYDDGGGGTKEQGKKYWDMIEEVDRLDNKASEAASKKAQDYVLNTYGEKKLSELKRIENAKIVGAMALVPVLIATAPISIPAAAIVSSVRSKMAEKKKKDESGK